MKRLETLSIIAHDLTAVLGAEDRYQRLLEALHLAIPYDSAALLRLENDILVPIAAKGLHPKAMATHFRRKDHPRLDIICSSTEPMLFSSDSKLPDPFDGLLVHGLDAADQIHACLGCPLLMRDQLVGVLVFDAINPLAFSALPKQYIQVIASLASAQLQTVSLLSTLEQEAERQGLLASDLMEDIQQHRGREMLGVSAQKRRLRQEIELVAKSDFTILIVGETGVGKELVARAVHNHSRRRDQPMLYLNCAALPTALAESELFGHIKGAFTGAIADRTGKFALADGGTLFLTKSVNCRWRFKPNCYERFRKEKSSVLAQRRCSMWMSASLPRPTGTWSRRLPPAPFELTSSIGSMSTRSRSRPCGNGVRISRCWLTFLAKRPVSILACEGCRSARRPSTYCSATSGPAMYASWIM